MKTGSWHREGFPTVRVLISMHISLENRQGATMIVKYLLYFACSLDIKFLVFDVYIKMLCMLGRNWGVQEK